MRRVLLGVCWLLSCSSAASPSAPAAGGSTAGATAAGSVGGSPGAPGGGSDLAGGPTGIAGSSGETSGGTAAGGVTASGQGGVAGGLAGAPVAGGGGAAGQAGGAGLPEKSGVLCVFDYDLTLSTNACDGQEFACRTNTCITYNWYEQCMSTGARHAIATCVERGAYIGIASHATVDVCWDDKVAPLISQMQFPELTTAARYDSASADFSYPKLDLRANWNCDDCAYHMNAGQTKPQLIAKVMKHYGMDPASATDRAKVIFWDDMLDNITKTNADMPEVHTVRVHQNIDGTPNSGGCGILDSDIAKGWQPFGL